MKAVLENPTLKAMMMAFIGFTLWAWGDAIIKYVGSHSPIMIAFFASIGSVGALCVLAPKLGGWHDTWHKPKLRLRMFRGALLMITGVMSIIGFSNLELTKAYAIVFCIPLLSKILSVFILKEKIRLQSWIISLTGLSGVFVVLRPGLVEVDGPSLALLCGAIFFAVGYILTRYIGEENQTPLSMSLFQYSFTLLVMGPAAFLFFDPLSVPISDIC